MHFQVCLELIFIWGGIITVFIGTFQQNVTVFLDDMSFKAVFGDGGIVALRAIVEMFSRVSTDMHVIMHLVPK